jgi:CII-binding regulator of phage lambda lysogenization HflD
LTIDKVLVDEFIGSIEYTLKVPNLEVQISLNRLIINYLTEQIDFNTIRDVKNSLLNADLENFKNTLHSLFASLPYNNYIKNQIAKVEGYWASLVYCYLAGAGLEIIAEDVTNKGRIDLTIKIENNIYIFEFKMKDNKDPLQQIKDREYYVKYQKEQKDIYLIGVEFDEEKRNIDKFEWEKLK